MKYRPNLDNKWVKAACEAAFYTLLAFVLSFLVAAPLGFSILSVFTNKEKNDFRISDLYSQIADKRTVRMLDNNIVVVDIGHSDRDRIADIFELIALGEPSAVGIDILFADPLDEETDQKLIEAISQLPNPILVEGLEATGEKGFKIVERSFLCDSIPGINGAASNLTNDFTGGAIREMTAFFPLETGDTLPSLAAAVAKAHDPDKYAALLKRGNEREFIDYPSREYRVFQADELTDNLDELVGRIVLAGSLVDASDVHSTPVSSSMPGLIIHANSASTILNGMYYSDTSDFIPDWLPALIITFLLLFLRGILPAGLRGLLTRVIQVFIIILAARIGYGLFVDKRIIFDFSYTMLMVIFAFFGMDIWNGIVYIWQKGVSFFRKIFLKPDTHSTR